MTFRRPKIPAHELPAKPSWLIGRDDVKSDIIKSVLAGKPVIILGSGGIGKTTLALAVLHDEEVAEKYNCRYFVSCRALHPLTSYLPNLPRCSEYHKRCRINI